MATKRNYYEPSQEADEAEMHVSDRRIGAT